MGELAGKEIINIGNGVRLGVIGESDMSIDVESGDIKTIILPRRGNIMNFWVEKQHMIIPWEAVKKIGHEVLIVDLDQGHLNFKRYNV